MLLTSRVYQTPAVFLKVGLQKLEGRKEQYAQQEGARVAALEALQNEVAAARAALQLQEQKLAATDQELAAVQACYHPCAVKLRSTRCTDGMPHASV